MKVEKINKDWFQPYSIEIENREEHEFIRQALIDAYESYNEETHFSRLMIKFSAELKHLVMETQGQTDE